MPAKAKRRTKATETVGGSLKAFPRLNSLPQELYEEIISYLHSDRESLRSCALVHSSWKPPSQKLLFHSIELTPGGQPTHNGDIEETERSSIRSKRRCVRLYNVLLSSPHLAHFIKELEIWEGSDMSLGGESWTCCEPTLPKLLRLIDQLETLTIADNNFNFNSTPTWVDAKLPNDLHPALSRIFAQPSLKSLKLEIKQLPPKRLFQEWTKLRHLRLFCVDLDEIEVAVFRQIDEEPIPLESLELYAGWQSDFMVLRWLLDPLCIVEVSRLRWLKLCMGMDDNDDIVLCKENQRRVTLLLEKAGSTLEWLGLQPLLFFLDAQENATLDPMRIDNLPCLRKLVIEIIVTCNHHYVLYPIDWLLEFVSRIGPRQSLEEIVVIFTLHNVFDINDIPELFDPPGAEWGDVDAALDEAPIPSLRRLMFPVNMFFDGDDPGQNEVLAANFSAHLNKKMPRCSKILEVVPLQGGNDLLWAYPM